MQESSVSRASTRPPALEHWIGSIPRGTGPLDRLALPHWCVHWGGVITNTVDLGSPSPTQPRSVPRPVLMFARGPLPLATSARLSAMVKRYYFFKASSS